MIQPSDLIPGPWKTWRPFQAEALTELQDWLTTPLGARSSRIAMSMGTGGGKSLLPPLLAQLTQSKTVVLTSTRGLQDQYKAAFPNMALVKGMNNYQCRLEHGVKADQGICTLGEPCPYRHHGCYFFDAVTEAKYAQLALANYAFYMATTHLQGADLLVCDEAHRLESMVESALTVELPFPPAPIPDLYTQLDEKLTLMHKNKELGKAYSRSALRELEKASDGLKHATWKPDQWVVEPRPNSSCAVIPIKPLDWHHPWSTAKKTLFMSATLTEKHLDRWGVTDCDFLEYGSSFPAKNTPIRHLWTARVNHYSTPQESLLLQLAMDKIIDHYPGRRGLVFTASYTRAKALFQGSQRQSRLYSHDNQTTVKNVGLWRHSEDGVIITPALVDGWDLTEADFIIVAKVPWPDTSGGVNKARVKQDPQWAPFSAMQTLVQETGRGTRSATDKCDVWLIDDACAWFLNQYAHFAPKWWLARWQGHVKELP